MPHQSLKLIPGVDQNRTLALNEAAISLTNLIRFIPDRQGFGLVQKLGGWTQFYPSAVNSIVRCLLAWEDINGTAWLGVGAEASLGVIAQTSSGQGGLRLITPQTTKADVAVSASTTLGSNVVRIDATGSGLDAYDAVDIQTQISVGGLIVFGLYAVTAINTSQFQVSVVNAIGDPVYATSTSSTATIPSFNFVSGQSTINVTLANHGYLAGDSFPILVATTVGSITLFGNYTISALDPTTPNDVFIISAASSATTTPTLTATGSSGTATLTYSTSYTIPVGSTIVVAGVLPSAFSGTFTVTASGAGTVSYAIVAGTYTQTQSGTIFVSVAKENGNLAQYIYYNGIGPLPANSGYGVGGYGGSASFPTVTATTTGAGPYTATVTFSGPTVVAVGSYVTIDGVTPAGYNGAWIVTASSAGSVSFTVPSSLAAQSVAGTLAFGGGYGSGVAPSAGTGTAITVTDWTLDNWGETLLACPIMIPPGQPVTATPSGGGIYQWSPTTNNPVATIIPTGPVLSSGMFVAMPQRQVIAWGSTFNGIQDQLLIRWSDVDNYGSWIGLPENQAGYFRIPKGSRIVQCIQGPQQGLIWTDLAVWAMQYVGQPYVYQFNEIGTGCGLIGRKAATSIGGIVYWMSQSQFFKLSSNGVEAIKCPVWDVIFQDLDLDNVEKIRVAANSQFNEIAWYYPTMSNGGEINAYVKYNITLDQWDFGTLARTAWINQSVLGPPIGTGTDTNIYQHETSPDANGQPINASFETGYFALSDADMKMFVDQVWPDMKWGYYGGAQSATVDLTFYATDYPGQTPIAYGPFTMTQGTTFVTPRMRGRLVSIKLESNDLGSFWRIGNMRYRVQPDGKY
jgi:hypothetical protein